MVKIIKNLLSSLNSMKEYSKRFITPEQETILKAGKKQKKIKTF